MLTRIIAAMNEKSDSNPKYGDVNSNWLDTLYKYLLISQNFWVKFLSDLQFHRFFFTDHKSYFDQPLKMQRH